MEVIHQGIKPLKKNRHEDWITQSEAYGLLVEKFIIICLSDSYVTKLTAMPLGEMSTDREGKSE